jgi:hypothetical protein
VEVTKPQAKAKVEVTKPQAKVEEPKVEEPKVEETKSAFSKVLTSFSQSFVQSMLPPAKPKTAKGLTHDQIKEKLTDSTWAGFGVASQDVTVDEHVQDGFTLSKSHLYNGPYFKSGIRKAYTGLFGKVNVSYRVVESNGKKYLNVFLKPWVEKEKATVTAPEPKPEQDEDDQVSHPMSP